jgi:hypothetical protein
MDEEDGRPEALAAKTGVLGDRSSSLGWSQAGQLDALEDVLPLSLCRINPSNLTNPVVSHRTVEPSHWHTREQHRSGPSLPCEPRSNHNYLGRRQLAPPQVVEEKNNETVPGK